ncbi:hypothetical protein [Profundibacter sp.]
MTITEMTAAINELHIATAQYEYDMGMQNDVPAVAFIGGYAGVYNLDDEQAERIAERAQTAEQFEDIWENEDWWV